MLDELLEVVVARGEDPDVALAAARSAPRRNADARRRETRRAGTDEPSARQRSRAAEPPSSCTLEDRRALAQQLRAAPEDLDGWRLAGDLSAGALDHAGERAYLCAQQLAAGAVLQRAARLVGPLKAATRTAREPMLEPWGGELDVEATLENLLGKPHPEPGDLIVQRRVDRRHQVVLMVDTSLSMAGEKMALAAVAAAVLALKLRPGDLAVVLFADGARVVSRFGEEVAPAELVRRMLAVPCGGGTDIAAALRLGHAELQRGRDPARQWPARERRRAHERRRPAAGGGAVRAAARAPHGGADCRPSTPGRRSPPGSRRACTSARPSPAPPTAASCASTASRRCRAACSRSPTACCDESMCADQLRGAAWTTDSPTT